MVYNRENIPHIGPGRGNEVFMKSILIILILIVLFVIAVRFIANHGGWQGGCNGNCASCASHCDDEEKAKKKNNE